MTTQKQWYDAVFRRSNEDPADCGSKRRNGSRGSAHRSA